MPGHRDFKEIGHTGGVVTFHVVADERGRASYSIGYRHSRPFPATLCGIYAHPDGFACGSIALGGIGDAWNPPPYPTCVAVFMASDSEGKFGHQCPVCDKHFRTASIPCGDLICPYCGEQAASFHFLTPPQGRFIKHYLATLDDALQSVEAGTEKDISIDMDQVADAVPGEPRPDFYYTSQAQQTQFDCTACGTYNDIRGKYGYCSACGTRNNASALRASLESIRGRMNDGALAPEEAVKQAVSEFDSCARNYVDHLEARTPMKPARRQQLQRLLFHSLRPPTELLGPMFDIDLVKGISETEQKFIRIMLARRHVYEHDGGVVTAKYLADSGDTSVEEGVLIRETRENAHRLIGNLNRVIETLDAGFHEIFEPAEGPIETKREHEVRGRAYGESR